MALVLAESKIPALIIAHLAARRSNADFPTPAANVLTLVAGPVKDTTKRIHPSLEVWVPSFRMKDRRDAEHFEVMFDLHAHPDTALATELGWLASIRRSFAGGLIAGAGNAASAFSNPFLAYIASLSAPAKADWELHDFYITGGSIVVLEEKRIVYRTTAECDFQSYVHTIGPHTDPP